MEEGGFFIIHAGKVTELVLKGTQFMCASIAQWQSISLVNQRSWVQSLLVAAILKLNISEKGKVWNNFVTPTWFEHTAIWSGVRHTTVVTRSQLLSCPTEIWTCIAGFKVQSANHYTIGPYVISLSLQAKQLLTPVSISSPKLMFPAGFEPVTLCSACEAHVIITTLRKLFHLTQPTFILVIVSSWLPFHHLPGRHCW